MPVSVSEVIQAPLERVWEIVSDFEGLRRWHPQVVRCDIAGRGIGAVRTVHFEDWWAQERLDRLNHCEHIVAYSVVDSSRDQNIGATGVIALTALGRASTRITWVAGLDASSVHAAAVNAALEAYYPVRIGHLKRALGLPGTD